MFTPFFTLLRARGINVSLNEWFTLTEALDRGLGCGGLSDFYFLCRSVLVKSEAEYSAYHRAFLEYFWDIIEASEQPLPQNLMQWLDRPSVELDNFDAEAAKRLLRAELDEIRRMFQERLLEQHEEHNGGSHWIGTGGMSGFGNAGNSPTGIRVGGRSMHRRAFEVAGERQYEDFRQDTVITPRQLQLALRKLRQFSAKDDAPRNELDLDATIGETCDNAGTLRIVYRRPRKNTVRLLLLMDSGGSMDEHRDLCAQLFTAVRQSNHFKDLRIYYFHNYIGQYLYTSPELRYRDRVETSKVLAELDERYKTIIFGDGEMSPYELTEQYYGMSGIERLRLFCARYSHLIWLTPTEMSYRKGSWYRASYDMIAEEVPMFVMTISDLERAFRHLMVNR